MAHDEVDFSTLVEAVVLTESNGDADAVSPCGAKGLMQLMDATGEECLTEMIEADMLPLDTPYEPFNPILNKQLGSGYLNKLLSRFRDHKLALAAYNCGPTRVSALLNDALERQKDFPFPESEYELIEPYLPKETRNYVKRAIEHYARLFEISEKENA